MVRIPQKTLKFFKQCGQRGGNIRAKRLTSLKRSHIAAYAACMRWRKQDKDSSWFASVRLATVDWNNPTYIEEILSDGNVFVWRDLYFRIFDQPYGDTAKALEKVLYSVDIYGVISLWKQILSSVQGIRL